jgi:hypothetical protein
MLSSIAKAAPATFGVCHAFCSFRVIAIWSNRPSTRFACSGQAKTAPANYAVTAFANQLAKIAPSSAQRLADSVTLFAKCERFQFFPFDFAP